MPGATLKDVKVCVADIKAVADANLTTTARDFYNSGSADQTTVAENTSAYSKYRLRPRVLVDVSKADPSTSVFGRRIDFPLCVSPAGIQKMAHADGEIATSRACAKRKIHMGISSYANYSVEEIRAAGLDVGPIEHSMQLYTMNDRALQERILRRAEAAGCVAVFLTADSPVLGVRYHEARTNFRAPEGLNYPMIETTSAEGHKDNFSAMFSSSHSWAREIPWLRSITKMQIWIKGILTSEDVLMARQYGCDGIMVSNHGGRQLDGTPATIDILPECVKAAQRQIPVHIDGGIRTGSDIFKALALGADCCWIGRPVLWGLAYNGEKGVSELLDILYNDFLRCMQLTGCSNLKDISPASLGIARSTGPLSRL